jgi:LPS-assembly protein
MLRRHNLRKDRLTEHVELGHDSGSRTTLRRLISASSLALAAALVLAPADGRAAPPKDGARMVVEAKELVYDQDKNIVIAKGDVQIYYKGRFLQADRVSYDRNTKRVYAEGHATMTERDGTIVHADHFDLTDDFQTGFIESVEVDTTDRTHFSAPRAERAGDKTTVFDLGTYTACEACKNDPTKPRLWQVRAKRIIHDNVEKMIYYEDASFELFGVPVAYVPFLSSPDPSVKRKTGLLNPGFKWSRQLGASVNIPLFWAISPDSDLTITPTYFSRVGPFVAGEFRQRFENGGYSIRAEGAYVKDRTAFAQAPYGARDRRWRGAVQSTGEFAINDFWKFGWDVNVLSDRFFMTDYVLYNNLVQNYFFREAASTAYLTGQGARSYFDLRGHYFQGLSPSDVQAQQPAGPVLDYNRAFDIDPARTLGIGGQLQLDANFISSTAELANYESIQPRTLDRFNGLYNVCQIYAPAVDRAKSGCLLRGIGGNYEHATLSADWKRKLIDPIGSVWTPFAFARFSGSYLDYNTTTQFPIFNNNFQPIPNAAQGLFVDGANQAARGQVTPGIGVEWRYPLLARSPLGNVVLEPIAQLIARPNQSSIPSLVNIDAQSLVFDDTNLFEWSKFSGYDRFETGTRLNYGGQATLSLPNGGYINALAGQSLQVAGANSYAQIDAANVGLSSGLNTRASDLVGRFAFAPASFFQFVAKGRFDKDNLAARRIDLVASLKLAPVTLDLQYANYASQPAIGFTQRRQGLTASGRYDITKNYFLSGNVTFDMSRYLYNNLTTNQVTTLTGVNLVGTAPVFSVASLGLAGGYMDECTTLAISYSSVYAPQAGTGLPARNQTILVSLQLRTLGGTKFSAPLGSVLLNDGVRARQ